MKTWPYVYHLTDKSGDSAWWCDTGKKTAPRKRKKFSSEDQARAQASSWRAEFQKGGSAAFLSDDERLDAINALKIYRKRSIKDTLQAAVNYYVAHRYPHGGNITLEDAIKDFKEAKEHSKKAGKIYRWSLNRLDRLTEQKAFQGRKLDSFTSRELMDYIYAAKSLKTGQPWAPETQRQHFRYFRMLFQWAVENQHLAVNPLTKKGVDQPDGRIDPPDVLFQDNVQKLLTASWKFVVNAAQRGEHDALEKSVWKHEGCDHRFFIYLVLGTFAGVRPQEISRLQWGALKADYNWLRITVRVSKTQDARHIPLPLNLQTMVQKYIDLLTTRPDCPTEQTPILPGYFDRFKAKFREWRREIIGDNWPHDCLRHTYASQFISAHNDTGELMNRLGHSQSKTTLNHYVNMEHDGNWKDFWTMMPDGFPFPTVTIDDPKEYKRTVLNLQ